MKYLVTLNGNEYEVEVGADSVTLTAERIGAVKAAPAPAPVVSRPAPAVAPAPAPAPAPAAAVSAPAAAVSAPAAPVSGSGTTVAAPMPGNILKVMVKPGDAVKSGQILLLLEAMKMENEIYSPCDGTVSSVLVSVGGTVNSNDPMVVIG
ncbi:acetyl-CoA carboxylase biotin carboxyl carrier protein subunit [Yanshouia hominis]|uniref:Acetyl-CoA carboxylase biotin carboxyl carrier protein subunit n=1 Tax=Yanshouia hominis TaxID=2763673 RepID=A0ABR7NGQ8_9FIRM|nr:acetyl-CoA carboxylase biotin carboxyl carrier protein subunit [Yanshouia hominis]MBC8575581.1 acetyl-CoA carboxylase biotin carboxyl carrier protein subunit [Yanshouia hominis]